MAHLEVGQALSTLTYHAHPFLAPNRKSLFYTEPIDGYSQICAVDVQELADLDEYWDRRA